MEETDEDLEWARSVDSSIQYGWVPQGKRVGIPNTDLLEIYEEIQRGLGRLLPISALDWCSVKKEERKKGGDGRGTFVNHRLLSRPRLLN